MKRKEKVGYPSGWENYQNLVMHTGASFFGFKENIGDVNRFAARFRAAKCLSGVRLVGYSSSVEAGYSSLCRVLFVYSAFETYLDITSNTRDSISTALTNAGADTLMKRIRSLDTNNRFYKFIYNRVNQSHKKELDNYFNEDPCNVAYLASAIRHIFAHGELSPSAGGSESSEAVKICESVSDFLLRFMDKDFACRIGTGYEQIYGTK